MTNVSLSAVLRARGVDPAATKLYRHSRVVAEVWDMGPDAMLLFSSLQGAGVFGPKLKFMAHFLPERTADGRHVSRFLGVTRILSEPRFYDGLVPPIEEIAAIDPLLDMSKAPLIVDQVWEPRPEDDPLSGSLLIEMGTPRRPIWAERPIKIIAAPPVEGESAAMSYIERREVRTHMAYERRAMPSDIVKSERGLVCEACGLDAEARFGSQLATRVIEAHHRRPISELSGGSREVTTDDFYVLCANCHRLIHGQADVGDLDALRSVLAGGNSA